MIIVNIDNEAVASKAPEVHGIYPFIYLVGGYDLNLFTENGLTATWMDHFIRKLPDDIKELNFTILNPSIMDKGDFISWRSEFLFLKIATAAVMYIPPFCVSGNTELMDGIVLGKYFQGGGPNKMILGIDKKANNFYSLHGLVSEYNKTMQKSWQFPVENNELVIPSSMNELVESFSIYMRINYGRKDEINVR